MHAVTEIAFYYSCETENKNSFTGLLKTSTHTYPADFKESIEQRVVPDEFTHLTPQQAMGENALLTQPAQNYSSLVKKKIHELALLLNIIGILFGRVRYLMSSLI